MTKILIVDDSRVARLALKRMVAGIMPDAVVIEAGCADDADALLAGEADPFDLALVDYNMPGRTGLEFILDLRPHYPHARIALVTANIQDALVERAEANNLVFIPKPCDTKTLKAFLLPEDA